MFDIVENISNIIEEQFPDFYKREGQEFILFVKEYFRFLEQEKNVLSVSRKIPQFRDIDTTEDRFLHFFLKKYMADIPPRLIFDKRFLQKHILDLYRSKGSIAGLKLLFRLLYNEEVDVYIPSYDILKPDSANWVQKRYFEVTKSPLNTIYPKKVVYGHQSGAKCIIDTYEERFFNGKIVRILYISDSFGDFIVGERLLYENYRQDASFFDSAKILGSPSSVNVLELSSGHQIGDELVLTEDIKTGKFLKLSPIRTIRRSGYIDFDLVNGGSGYTKDAQIIINPDSEEEGFGASFEIEKIINTETFYYNATSISPYENVLLTAETFSANVSDNSSMDEANLNSPISPTLKFEILEVGTIDTLKTTNTGKNYTNNVNVEIIDPYTSSANLPDGQGGIKGKNAIVTTSVVSNELIVPNDGLKVIDSGFGFNDETIKLTAQNTQNTNADIIEFNVNLSAIGKGEGLWVDRNGFIDDNKFLQDDFFYQEYSYQIKSSKTLDKYKNILYAIMHPSGNEVFGKAYLFDFDRNSFEKIDWTENSKDFYSVQVELPEFIPEIPSTDPTTFVTFDSTGTKFDSTQVFFDSTLPIFPGALTPSDVSGNTVVQEFSIIGNLIQIGKVLDPTVPRGFLTFDSTQITFDSTQETFDARV